MYKQLSLGDNMLTSINFGKVFKDYLFGFKYKPYDVRYWIYKFIENRHFIFQVENGIETPVIFIREMTRGIYEKSPMSNPLHQLKHCGYEFRETENPDKIEYGIADNIVQVLEKCMYIHNQDKKYIIIFQTVNKEHDVNYSKFGRYIGFHEDWYERELLLFNIVEVIKEP